ncbi:MAG TPA: TonB-dependent receptor [Caulobacteraceae bacterium]|jgi:iron complex outermembrane receptor protein|nr:TonB-dependent receptor [Caulobacteraceae bacterium]
MKKSLFATVAILSALAASEQAWAQAPASTSFEEVIVTAQKRTDKLQDVPLSVTAVTGNVLAQGQVTNLADLQNSVPNLNISPRNSSGVVAIRGIGFDVLTVGAEGSVAVHTDGVYQSRPTAALASLYDVDRIEIARGPQGTLYGRNATGGAINIISRRPGAVYNGYVNLSYGNYGAYSAEAAIGGPVAGDVLRLRIAGKVDHHDGYGTNLYNGSDIDNLNSGAVRGTLEYNPTPKASFSLIADYFKRDDNAYAPHFAGCLAVCSPATATQRGFTVPANLRDVNIDVEPTNRNELWGTALTSTFDLNFAELTSISAFRHGSSYYIFDLDGTAQKNAFLTREEDYHQASQELRLGKQSETIDWLVGAYYFHEHNNARSNGHFPDFQAPALTQIFMGGILTTDAYAAFGEGTWRPIDKLSLTVGARYSDETKRVDDERFFTGGPAAMIARQAAPTAAVPCKTCLGLPNEVSFHAFTPKASLEYRPAKDVMLYATVQKGFKSGGFAVGQVAPAFAPETIWSYEVGMKASWLERRVITNISAYHYDYSNLQVGQVLGLSSVISNAGRAKVDGVEVEAKAKLGYGFQIDAQGAYNDARFTSYQSANGGINPNLLLNLKGNQLSNAPKWTGNLGLEYMAPAFGGDVTLRGEIFKSSRVYFSPFNDLNNSQQPYALLNASVKYQPSGGHWFASAYINNIENETVKGGSLVTVGAVGSWINTQLLPPRTFGVKVGASF